MRVAGVADASARNTVWDGNRRDGKAGGPSALPVAMLLAPPERTLGAGAGAGVGGGINAVGDAVSPRGAIRHTVKAEALAHALADAREEAYSRLRSAGRTVFPARSDTGLPVETLSPEAREAAARESRMILALAAEARDPHTSPERLTHLATEVRRFAPRRERNPVYDALAANPNTPPDLLAFLMPLCPAALAANPILPLLPLEMPDFTARVSRQDRLDLLRRGDLPAPLVRLLRTDADPEVSETAALHVAVAGEVMACEDAPRAFREYLCRRAARPEETDGLNVLRALCLVPDGPLVGLPETLPTLSPADTARLRRLAVGTLAGSPLPAPSKGDSDRPLTGVARYLALRVLLRNGSPAERRLLPDSAVTDRDFLVRLAVAETLPPARATDRRRLAADGNRFVRAAVSR